MPTLHAATNAFSKKLENHVAAVALYVAHYNFCRVHENAAQHAGSRARHCRSCLAIGELIDAALTAAPPKPAPTAPDRRRQFRVIEGGRA